MHTLRSLFSVHVTSFKIDGQHLDLVRIWILHPDVLTSYLLNIGANRACQYWASLLELSVPSVM